MTCPDPVEVHAAVPDAPPPAFVNALKDALERLYDIPCLNAHPLTRWLLVDPLPPGVSHAHALRQKLLDAIEQLNPGQRPAASTRGARAYRLLSLRYVEAMPFREVMRSLAISQTQYHREQRHALDTLATYLWDTRPTRGASPQGPPIAEGATPPKSSDVAIEEAQVEAAARSGDDTVRLGALVNEVVGLVEKVASIDAVTVRLVDPRDGPEISTSRTTLRQVLIGVLGWLVETVQGGEVQVRSSVGATMARIEIACSSASSRPPADSGAAPDLTSSDRLELSRRLLRSMGGDFQIISGADGELQVALSFPTRRITLLVIDDNPHMVQLVGRYLADQRYSVVGANSVARGVEIAQQTRPDIVLLDIMLPHRDGWDALQVLRHHPATAEIPIVVCTILAEERLALALGASAFIRKPLTRPELLRVLDQCLAQRSRPVEADREAPESPAASEHSSAPDL